MQEYVTCPNCQRYISLEQIEAPCQLCGRDMCSYCMHVCPDCGKEVCNEHWSNGRCIICNRKSWVSTGYDKFKASDDTSGKAIGIGTMAAGAFETARQHGRLKEEREIRRMGEKAYRKRENLESVFLIVTFSILIPVAVISLSHGRGDNGNIPFMIFGGIFALAAGFYAKWWAENRYYNQSHIVTGDFHNILIKIYELLWAVARAFFKFLKSVLAYVKSSITPRKSHTMQKHSFTKRHIFLAILLCIGVVLIIIGLLNH